MPVKDRPNFNIAGADPVHANEYRAISKKLGKSLAETLPVILAGYNGNPVAPADTSALDKEIADLKENNTEIAAERNAAINVNTTLQAEIEALKIQLQETQAAAAALQIKPPAYIFTPSAELKKNMQRAVIFLDKKGKLDKRDPEVLQKITEKSIGYFIKNELPEVLK